MPTGTSCLYKKKKIEGLFDSKEFRSIGIGKMQECHDM
jgi:hypothetical protein